ncbi:glycosyltransferase [Mammaliicoccus sciuri]|uniref:glycosyltransferase n=1 Tax=Mammaliicoccus sciuri TaxID=1296 RepID=UPI0018E12787|nr:glycosyltransferase [Mammaliicoccus sciuri]MCE4979425.1 glycosyltransferase [Mammaliicoccus sciuri]MCE5084227.1 glycosyltransferase [Mammaliicoccus sciuri]MCE5093799.1 glycosyltransferase [Mammaliicoccus sciuri]MCJ0967274.1 glycosyltransferase [Mammaliicoccus sciuri]MDT0668771.1 glycosyltransferase [Mammaliicoccus sciuri]
MIYTVTSTLPEIHGGRTKSLLHRIALYNRDLNVKQTIVTTNYNPNYESVYSTFISKKTLNIDTHIVNLYDWLSNFKLHNFDNVEVDILKYQPVRIKNYYAIPDYDKNCVRYYDNDTGRYLLYRQYYPNSEIVKFEDYFAIGIKHKTERWEYNINGVLHKITNYCADINKKLIENFYDLEGNIYCKKYFEDNETNKLKYIYIYKNGILNSIYKTENDLFKYFFNCLFKKGDIVFNDARLLDRPLLDCKVNIKPILVFHSAHKVDGETKNSYKYALNNSDKVAKYYLLTYSQQKDIQEEFNIENEKFVVIPHFIEKSNEIAEKKDQFVYLGRFDENKQIPHLIKSFKKFNEHGYETKLVLYGGTDDKEKNKIKKMVKEYELENYVEIHDFTNNPGLAFRESLASLLTSKFEGFALTVMESINENCPTISYDIKYGPSEIIVDGENGYLIEENNIDAFAEAMVKIKQIPLNNVGNKKELSYESAISNLNELINVVNKVDF